MSTETEIQAEVEALKARFSETKALYREVCALLFFRHGIAPTASKLYQYVRKGSMSVPAEALARFWEELRGKAKVQIDHPDLPEALKQAAADAVQTLWTQATDLAREELAALRLEAQASADQALADLARQEASNQGLQAQILESRTAASDLRAEHRQLNDELQSERRSHAASLARADELQRQVNELLFQQERVRADFAAELEKSRTAVQASEERALGSERRALLEIDRERVARANAEKQLEALRAKQLEAERHTQARALDLAAQHSRISTEFEAAQLSLGRLQANFAEQTQQLLLSQEQATQFKSEAQTLRALLEQFKPVPAPAPSPKSGRTKRGQA
ncbi:DNA repair exonuclease SbcCD ATPase subunit [Paucibacter oligotrophus]|uniref:DNA repair exonuclease SbcCD ATPase subunit n=1 Tax=Roseateles oligotrophus TaxID=1769250 RepID=A0A840LC70_9BURK|nr:DNA-binding protein [Roseateles oligotrophus]MBB4844252.1 DNA repair exonuclease SbcCD ATPase subunit [Roseateles oligotrophus]